MADDPNRPNTPSGSTRPSDSGHPISGSDSPDSSNGPRDSSDPGSFGTSDSFDTSRTAGLSGDAIPSPALVAAWWALDRVLPERLPGWAAGWLAQGLDGPALRDLAGLGGGESAVVRELVPEVFAELGVAVPDPAVTAVNLSLSRLARMCLAGRAAELWVAQKVEELMSDGQFVPGAGDAPLVRVVGLAETWADGARSEAALRAEVRAACVAQLRVFDVV